MVGVGTSDFFGTALCQPFPPETEVACRNPPNLAMDPVFCSDKRQKWRHLLLSVGRPVDERRRQTWHERMRRAGSGSGTSGMTVAACGDAASIAPSNSLEIIFVRSAAHAVFQWRLFAFDTPKEDQTQRLACDVRKDIFLQMVCSSCARPARRSWRWCWLMVTARRAAVQQLTAVSEQQSDGVPRTESMPRAEHALSVTSHSRARSAWQAGDVPRRDCSI